MVYKHYIYETPRYDSAHKYMLKNMYEGAAFIRDKKNFYTDLGTVYYELGNFDSAAFYFNEVRGFEMDLLEEKIDLKVLHSNKAIEKLA